MAEILTPLLDRVLKDCGLCLSVYVVEQLTWDRMCHTVFLECHRNGSDSGGQRRENVKQIWE